MAKGSGYFTKGGQFMAEASQVMSGSTVMADGAMYYKERRQRYVGEPSLSPFSLLWERSKQRSFLLRFWSVF